MDTSIDYELLTAIATMLLVVVLSSGAIFMVCVKRKENKK